MMLEQDLSGEKLAGMIGELMNDPGLLRQTGEAAFGLARLDAAQIIVDEMMKSKTS